MIYVLLIVLVLGLVLTSWPGVNNFNPFQVFFALWLTIVIFYLGDESWYEITPEFLALLIATSSTWLLIYIKSLRSFQSKKTWSLTDNTNLTVFYLLLVVLCVGMPFVYRDFISQSAYQFQVDINNYRSIRQYQSDFSDDVSILGYLRNLSAVVSVAAIILWFNKKISWQISLLSLTISMAYIFMSTGRTFLIFLVFPVIVLCGIYKKHYMTYAFALVALIGMIVITYLTGKTGAQSYESLTILFVDFISSLRSYFVAPFVAMGNYSYENYDLYFGMDTFRFFYAAMSKLGIYDFQVSSLVQGYAFIPDPTNVYTVFLNSYKDFGYLGSYLYISIIGYIHCILFKAAKQNGSIYNYLYAFSFYPLFMQFFQDQYMMITSTWIQVFVYTIILNTKIRIHVGESSK